MMKNSKNLIIFSLLFMVILAFSTMIPERAYANITGYNAGQGRYPNLTSTNGYNGVSGYNTYNNGYYAGNMANPVPKIYLVNPNSVNKNLGYVRVAITGDGFVPGAIVKLNGIDQITTYVNSSRIEMQLNDLAKMGTGNFIVNVYNPTPGGGFSNSATLNISDSTGVYNGANTSNTTNTTVTKKTTASPSVAQATKSTTTVATKDETLAASVILGTGSFLPSSLIQWIIFLLFILILVYLWRKIYITEKEKSTPLKHH